MLERFDLDARGVLLGAREKAPRGAVTSHDLARELLRSAPHLFDRPSTLSGETRLAAAAAIPLGAILEDLGRLRPEGPIGVADLVDALSATWAALAVLTNTPLGRFLQRVDAAPKLSRAEERELVSRVKAEGLGSEAALRLIEAGLRLVVQGVRKSGRAVTLANLVDPNRAVLDALDDLEESGDYLAAVDARLSELLAI